MSIKERLRNHLQRPAEAEQPDTVFNTLKVGQRFNNGQVVFKRDDVSITVKRADGWLVTVNKGDWAWGKMVKVETK